MVYALLLTILAITTPLINCQPGGKTGTQQTTTTTTTTTTTSSPNSGGGPGSGSGPSSGNGDSDSSSTTTLCDIDGNDSTYSETISDDLRIITASGCPNHYSECIGKEGICEEGDGITEASVINKEINIPAYPCISNYEDDSSYDWNGYPVYCLLGSLGIALNGVSIYSPSANTECKDALGTESEGFDYCGGHGGPTGEYHYHVGPACLLDQLGDSDDTTDGHSPQIGWAYDGFPVYGPHGSDGEYIKLCTEDGADSEDCLDNCSGHDQHEIDGFKYHYHVASPVGDLYTNPIDPTPDSDRWPYTFGCYRGIPSDWSQISISGDEPSLECVESGVTDDYVPKPVSGVTDVYVSPYASSYTDDGSGESNNNHSTNTTIAVIVIVLVIMALCIFAGFCYYKKKYLPSKGVASFKVDDENEVVEYTDNKDKETPTGDSNIEANA